MALNNLAVTKFLTGNI